MQPAFVRAEESSCITSMNSFASNNQLVLLPFGLSLTGLVVSKEFMGLLCDWIHVEIKMKYLDLLKSKKRPLTLKRHCRILCG